MHGTYGHSYTDPPTYLPMGARLRLKNKFDLSNYDPVRKAVIPCLQTYGAIVADNGTNFAVTAVNDDAAFRAALGGQLFGPSSPQVDDASFRLWDKPINGVLTDVCFGDLEVMALGPVTKLPPLH